MTLTRRVLLAAPALLLTRPGGAQAAWPTRAVRLISSSPPAGASDILTRTLGNSLQMQLGQSFIIENRPGGGGIIGADAVAKSPPDGYVWLTTAVASQAINATLMHQPYDPRKDFRHVTIFGRLPLVLLVNKDLPIKTLADYVALAKAKPGALNFGTGGVGTLHHLTAELLKIAAGIDIVHVPYRGAQASTQDVIGGRIESMFDSLPSAAPHIRTGLMRAIAVSGDKRNPSFPEIPTIAEQGYPTDRHDQLVRHGGTGRRAGRDRQDDACQPGAGARHGRCPEQARRSRRRAGRRHARRDPGVRAVRDRALGQGHPADRNQDQLTTRAFSRSGNRSQETRPLRMKDATGKDDERE